MASKAKNTKRAGLCRGRAPPTHRAWYIRRTTPWTPKATLNTWSPSGQTKHPEEGVPALPLWSSIVAAIIEVLARQHERQSTPLWAPHIGTRKQPLRCMHPITVAEKSTTTATPCTQRSQDNTGSIEPSLPTPRWPWTTHPMATTEDEGQQKSHTGEVGRNPANQRRAAMILWRS